MTDAATRKGRWTGGALAVGVAVGLLAALGALPDRPAAAQSGRSQFLATFEYKTRYKAQLQKLAALQQQKSWDEWLNNYQTMVDDNPDGVIERDSEFHDGM